VPDRHDAVSSLSGRGYDLRQFLDQLANLRSCNHELD